MDGAREYDGKWNNHSEKDKYQMIPLYVEFKKLTKVTEKEVTKEKTASEL